MPLEDQKVVKRVGIVTEYDQDISKGRVTLSDDEVCEFEFQDRVVVRQKRKSLVLTLDFSNTVIPPKTGDILLVGWRNNYFPYPGSKPIVRRTIAWWCYYADWMAAEKKLLDTPYYRCELIKLHRYTEENSEIVTSAKIINESEGCDLDSHYFWEVREAYHSFVSYAREHDDTLEYELRWYIWSVNAQDWFTCPDPVEHPLNVAKELVHS